MKIASIIIFVIVASSCTCVVVHGKDYDKFQPLGFSIYTGGAPIVLSSAPTASSSCISGVPTQGDDCGVVVYNPECQCVATSTTVMVGSATNNNNNKNTKTLKCNQGIGNIGTTTNQQRECYLGKQNLQEDVAGRMAIMKQAVERAYQVADHTNSTLKIFMAPELYWRGPTGAYPLSSMMIDPHYDDGSFQVLKELRVALQELVAQEKFQDWLFVFGTTMASNDDDTTADKSNKGGDDDYEEEALYMNFAHVLRGYDPKTESSHGKRMLIPKHYVSRYDFMSRLIMDDTTIDAPAIVTNPYNATAGTTNKATFYNVSAWTNILLENLHAQGYMLVTNGWFYMDNIAFSVEICVDHRAATALTSLLDNLANTSETISSSNDGTITQVPYPNTLAQISLVSSAGMSVKRSSLALTNGGTIFLVDGLKANGTFAVRYLLELDDQGIQQYVVANDSLRPLPSDVTAMLAKGADDDEVVEETLQLFGLDNTRSYDRVDVYDSAEDAATAMDGLYSKESLLGSGASKFPPQIHIFEPILFVKLPWPSTWAESAVGSDQPYMSSGSGARQRASGITSISWLILLIIYCIHGRVIL
jgi:hypothetical protein